MLLAVLTLGSTVSALAAQPASAASNGLWSVFPTTLHGQAPRAFVRPMLTPGKGYEDSVTVANYTSAPLTFNLYSADAINTRGGGLSLKRRTDLQTDIGKWIRLPYQRLTVPAHGASIVPFIVEAPINATPGDHVGGIVAEDTQGTTTKSGSVPVTVIEAVGVRVYGRVVGPLHPELALSHVSLHVSESAGAQFGGSVDTYVRFTLRNSGNTVLSPRTRVVLASPFGTAAQRSLRIDELLPGSAVSYAVTMGGIGAYGHLQARVTAASAPVSASATAAAWLLPWGLLVILVLLLLLLCAGVWLLVRRLRRRRRRGRHSQAHRSSSATSEPRATDVVVAEDEEHESSFVALKEAPTSAAGSR